MFFNIKSRQAANPIHYFVSFVSPYFLVYVKCPKATFWQLARQQNEPTRLVDGTTNLQVQPVLLFSSRDEAEEYATDVLGLVPKALFFPESGSFALWRNVEQFEALTLPEEIIQVQKTFRIAPVVFRKEQSVQINSVRSLPVVERRRQ